MDLLVTLLTFAYKNCFSVEAGRFVLPLRAVRVDRKEGRPCAEGGKILSGRWAGPGHHGGEVPAMKPGALAQAVKPRPLRAPLICIFNKCYQQIRNHTSMTLVL